MLSVENPPPDPPCPCDISRLKISDERASVNTNLPLSEVDLFQSAVDDGPLPKFSIRDYVNGARSKDINTNWPFSRKTLQLCLKHGVKDPLPPFQSLDSVRSRSFQKCPAKSSLLDKFNITCSDGEPSGLPKSASDHDSNWKDEIVVASHLDVNSCRSPDFPSTTTSNSQTDIDSVAPIKRTSCSATGTQLEPAAVGAPPPPVSDKINNGTVPSSIKKCSKLIVKFSSSSYPSSTEDIASNSTTLSEAMTSKICPVCKTFSSTSNTTLNAHIDQCLSADSTNSNWMPDAKLTAKYRIKPRKMRSMVDIYETAPRCTLEDLDRRNGSSWARDSALPNQDTEVCAQGKQQRASLVCPEDAADEGQVYIDASGTKLRILSKFSSPTSMSQVREDQGLKKPFKGGKRSNFFSPSKKKRHKYLKLTPQSKEFSSPKARSSQIHGGQDGDYGMGKNLDNEDRAAQPSTTQGRIKPSDSGTLRQWACSKRTGLSKKTKTRDSQQNIGCKLHMAQDLLVEKDQSCLRDSRLVGSSVQRCPISIEKVTSCGNNQRTGSLLYGNQIDNERKRSPSRKRVWSPLVGDQICENVERPLKSLKQNSLRLSTDTSCARESFMLRPSKCAKDQASILSSKKAKINEVPVKNSGNASNSHGCHASSSKATKFSSLRKEISTLRPSFMPQSKINLNSNPSTFKTSQVPCAEEMDEEVAAWPSEMDGQYDSVHNHNENQFAKGDISEKGHCDRTSGWEIRHKRGATRICQKDRTMVGSKIGSCVEYGEDVAGKFDCLEPARREAQLHDENVFVEQSLKRAAGCPIMTFSRSPKSKYDKINYSSDKRSNSLTSVEEYKGPLSEAESPVGSTAPSMGDERAMFYDDRVGDGIIRKKSHTGAEFGCKVMQGNDFTEIDPIPIPGPPGSFLPSPGEMSSEDFQGNSSLTTSRIHSSQDHEDFVDGESSDSPISATSTVSGARSFLNCSDELLSVGRHAVKEKIQTDFSCGSIELAVENGAMISQTPNIDSDRIISDVQSLKGKVVSPKARPLKLKDDNQPCCCSRKERISQVVPSNYQDSQLLRRRTTASSNLPGMVKPMGCNINARSDICSLSSNPTFVSDRVLVLPVEKSSRGPASLNCSSGSMAMYRSSGDSDSASPSASTPILRLMGKDLMVVNKGGDLADIRGPGPGSPNNCSNPQFLKFSGVSPGNIQKLDNRSLGHMVPQDPGNIDYDYYNWNELPFDVRFCKGFGNHISSPTPQAHEQTQASVLAGKRIFSSVESLEAHEYKDESKFSTQMCRHKNLPDASSTLLMEKTTGNHDPQCVTVKEIIVLDDTPESEVELSNGDFMHPKGLVARQVSSDGNSTVADPDCSSRHVNHHYSCHQTLDPSSVGKLPINTFFHGLPSKGANTNPARWGCTSDCSGVLQRGPFVASSSSTSHTRPALYFSPSLS